jgi:hypothetical protein
LIQTIFDAKIVLQKTLGGKNILVCPTYTALQGDSLLLVPNEDVGKAYRDAPASHIIKMLITREHFFHSTLERRCTHSHAGNEKKIIRTWLFLFSKQK